MARIGFPLTPIAKPRGLQWERRGVNGVGRYRSTYPHMKNIIGIILIALGVFLFVQGLNRKDSLAGAASTAGTQVANAVDGGARQPKHVIYMVGGGVLAIIGIAVMVKKPRSV